MDVTKLESGRELDALVAERVFGFCIHQYEPFIDPRSKWSTKPLRCTKCGKESSDLLEENFPVRYPPYSIDIAAADPLWDRLAEDGWDISIYKESDQAWRFNLNRGREFHSGWAETRPLLACRAALAAVRA